MFLTEGGRFTRARKMNLLGDENNLLFLSHPHPQEHIRQSKESKLDELGRHSTKWTVKQQIQIRDMECMSVKYPPPPLSPITRKDVMNGGRGDDDDPEDGGGGGHTVIPGRGIDRYGFGGDHVMPPPMKMTGHHHHHPHHAAIGLQTYDSKGSVANIPANDYEVSGHDDGT